MQLKQTQTINLSIYIATLGIIIFLSVSNLAPLKDKFLAALYPKGQSHAQEILNTPEVKLHIIYQDKKMEGVLNIREDESDKVALAWETQGNPTSCYGWSSGRNFEDQSWEGGKDTNGGVFKVPQLNSANAYIYNIECLNEYGDAAGDSITLNVGSQDQLIAPYISSINVYNPKYEKFDSTKPINVLTGQEVRFQWESVNTKTPLSVCVATGSWPIRFRNPLNSSFVLKQQIESKKVYRFRIYCSNEKDSTESFVTLVGE